MTSIFPNSISSFYNPTNPTNSLHQFTSQFEKDIKEGKVDGFFRNEMDDTLKNASYFSYAFGKDRSDDGNYDPYITAGLGQQEDELQRLNYIKGISNSSVNNSQLELEELARQNLAEGAFSAFNSDIYNLTLSGNKVLGRIMGAFNINNAVDPTLSFDEQEKRKRNYDKFTASVVYQHIYNYGNYSYGASKVYAGLGIDYKNTPSSPSSTQDEAKSIMRNIVKGEEFSVHSNVFRIHKELVSIYPDLLAGRKYGKSLLSNDLVSTISKRVIDETDYVSKPGIRQAVSLIESSTNSLTIDLFQLQNKAISDVLISKLQREQHRIASGDFKVNIRLSAPSNSSRANLVGYQILGPNILIMERLMRIRDDLAKNITNSSDREKLMTSNFKLEFIDTGSYHAKVFTNDRVAQIGSFNWTSPVGNSVHQSGSNYEEIHLFHNKLEQLGIYDSLNKRRVLGTSSAETLMNTERGMELAMEELNKKSYNTLTSDTEKEAYRTSKVFLQTRLLNQRGLYREEAGKAFTRSNIGLAGDIGQSLRTTVQFLTKNKGSAGSVNELYMNLNQVWLLQLDNSLYYGSGGDYRGEMGPMDNNNNLSNLDVTHSLDSRRRVYREQQKDLFKLILENRAFISVDPRNYREKILHPLEEKVKLLLGRQEAEKQIRTGTIRGNVNALTDEQLLKIGTEVYYKEFNGSISNLTNRVGNSESGLLKLLGLNNKGVNEGFYLQRLGINSSKVTDSLIKQDASLTAQQLLAVGSGNIIMTTETMSHVKNFIAVKREKGKDFKGTNPLTPLSYYSGSSNLGYESTAFSTLDTGVVSTEAGLILMGNEVRSYGQSKGYLQTRNYNEALSDEEEQDELNKRFVYPFREWERLTQTPMLGGDATQIGTKAIWESKVSAWGLHQMKERVEHMNKSLGYSSGQGIKMTPIYGSKGEVSSYMLTFSTKSMTGGGYGDISVGYQEFKYRFTVLKDLSGKPGLVYLIDQNKVIGNSLLFNKTGTDITGLPFNLGDSEQDFNKTQGLKDRESLRLSPIDTFMSLIGTMSGEVAYRTLVNQPMSYLNRLKEVKTSSIGPNSSSMLGKAGLDYLKFLGTGINTPDGTNDYIKFFESLDIDTAYTISKKFGYRHVYGTTDTGKKALQLSAGEYRHYDGTQTGNETHLIQRVDIMKNVMNIATINQHIKTLKGSRVVDTTTLLRIQQFEEQRTALLTHMMGTFDELIDTQNKARYQADIGLGIMESRRDPFYNQTNNNILKELKAGLLEPFITMGQASFYGSSQAWFRNPLFEITPQHNEFLSLGAQGIRDNEGSLKQIFRFAMAQPYIFGPTDTIGTNVKGMIRGVAEGGGATETVEDGYSLFGRKKANVGDVMDMEVITYAGVGTITTRSDLENRVLNLLYQEYSIKQQEIYKRAPISKSDFDIAIRAQLTQGNSRDINIIQATSKYSELISTTPLGHKNIHGESYVDEFLTFTFSGASKLGQVPQRLKNVVGSKPMYEIDSAFGYLTRSRGRGNAITSTLGGGKVVMTGSYETNYETLQSIIHRTHSIDSQYLFNGKTDVKFTADNYLEGLHRFRKAQLMELILDKYMDNSPVNKGTYINIIEDIKRGAVLNSDTSMNIELERLINGLSGVPEEDKRFITNKFKLLYKEVTEVLGADTKLALINAGGIRVGLTQHQHEMLQTFKQQLSNQYGFNEEQYQDESHIARYILMSALRSTDMLASGIKGFTGGKTQAKGDSAFILVQLSGAYSDYAYTNPLFGTDIEFLNQVRTNLGSSNEEVFIPGYGNIKTTDWKALTEDDKDKLGVLTGFTEKAEKRQKSSMLLEDWFVNGSMIAKSGDIVTYDIETNRVLVWGSKESLRENQIPKDRIDMSKLSNSDKENLRIAAIGQDINKVNSGASSLYYLKEAVDSRDQVSAISGVIDNFRTIDDLPNISLLERQTWYRNAEQSIEYLLSAKQLTGISDNSQLLWEFIYNRSILMGGGRRVEGMGMLAKAVSIMADPSLFELILPQLAGTAGAFGNVTTDLHNIAGLYNPSNLKSYVTSHGQEIIRHEEYIKNLINSINGKFNLGPGKRVDRSGVMTSAILMTFGDSFIKDNNIKRGVYTQLFQKAMGNEMGGWMRNIAITSVLTGSNKVLMSKLNTLSASMGSTVSMSDIINGIINPSSSIYHAIPSNQRNEIIGLLADSFGSNMSKALSDMTSTTQVPINKVIDQDLFLKAVQGDTKSINYLNTLITNYIDPESVRNRRKNVAGVRGKVADYIISNDLGERNAALAAGNLDIIIQLMSQKDMVTIPNDINLNDNRTLLTILAISGHSELNEITYKVKLLDTAISFLDKQEIEKELDVLRSLVRGMTLSSNVLKLKADFLPSQSKEPVGSKHTGGLEFQHLVKSLHQNADHFGKTGKLSDLRKVMANMFAAISQNESMATMDTIMERSNWMGNKPVYDISDVQNVSVIHAHKFIGLYEGMSIEDQNLLKQVRNDFKQYGQVVEGITSHIMTELGNTTGNTLKDKARRIALTNEIQDLLTIMPEVSATDTLFTSNIKYLVEDASTTDKIGVRESTESQRIKDLLDKYAVIANSVKDKKGQAIDTASLIARLSSLQTVLTGREYQLNPNKAFGMGSISPVIEGLNYDSFMFALPSFFVEGQTEEGGTKLRFDFSKEASQYSYLLSSKELTVLGDQYGSYVDELVAKTLMLASAFTPGTEMNNIRNLIQRSKMSGDSSLDLTKEEYALITKFYETAVGQNGIVSLMAEAGADVRSQQITAGKVRLSGIVTIPAASFLVSPGSILLAPEGERRQVQMSYDRYQAYLGAQGKYNKLGNLPESNNPIERLNKKRLLNYYESMQNATLYGLSEEGTRSHQQVLDIYKDIKARILNTGTDLVTLNQLEEEINRIRTVSKVRQTPDNKGNVYVKRLGEVLEVDLKDLINKARQDIYKTGKLGADTTYQSVQALLTQYINTSNETNTKKITESRLRLLDMLFVSRGTNTTVIENSLEIQTKMGINIRFDSDKTYHSAIKEVNKWLNRDPSLRAKHTVINRLLTKEGSRLLSSGNIKNDLWMDLMDTLNIIGNADKEGSKIVQKLFYKLTPELNRLTQIVNDYGTSKSYKPKLLSKGTGDISLLNGLSSYNLMEGEMEGGLRPKIDPFSIENLINTETDKGTYLKYLVDNMKTQFETGVLNEVKTRSLNTFEMPDAQYQTMVKKSLTDISALVTGLTTVSKMLSTVSAATQKYSITEGDINILTQSLSLVKGIPQGKAGVDRATLLKLLDIQEADLAASIITPVGGVPSEGKVSIGINQVQTLINTLVNSLDSSDVSQVLGFRSPPPGGTEAQRYTLQVLNDISLLNDYSSKVNGGMGLQYDSTLNRNRSLTLVSPISLLTMGLGDFDGDPYTTIYSNFMDHHRSLYKNETRLSFIKDVKLKQLRDKLTPFNGVLGIDANTIDQTGAQSLLTSNPNLETSNPDFYKALRAFTQTGSQLVQLEKDIALTQSKIQVMNHQIERGSYTKAVKKEVTNYLGLSGKYFTSSSEGGYRDQDASTSVMLTMIDQGAGLFGGIRNKAPAVEATKNLLTNLMTSGSTTGHLDAKFLQDLISAGSDPTAGQVDILTNVLRTKLEIGVNQDTNPFRASYAGLLMGGDEGIRSFVRELNRDARVSIEALNKKYGTQTATDYFTSGFVTPEDEQGISNEILASMSARMLNKQASLSVAQSIFLSSAGVSLDKGSYDMLTYTMGKAGGDILGKTYNTFIGVIYRDSPLVALGHVMQDENLNAALGDHFADNGGSVNGMTHEDFLNGMQQRVQKAEALQGYIKNINQLLRDGIKPKGGSDLLAQLKEWSEQYEQMEKGESYDLQEELITKIAGGFGPSDSNIGMNAFIQLSSLVTHRENLIGSGYAASSSIKVIKKDDGGVTITMNPIGISSESDQHNIGHILGNLFGITTNFDGTKKDIDVPDIKDKDSQDTFTKLVLELYEKRGGTGTKEFNAFDVAALKTSRDLQGLIVAYQYSNMTGSGFEKTGKNLTSMNDMLRTTVGRYAIEQGLYDPSNPGLNPFTHTQIVDQLMGSSGYTHNGIIHNQSTVNDWLSNSMSNNATHMYLLTSITGKSEQDVRRDLLGIDINGTFKEDSRLTQKSVMYGLLEHTLDITQGLYGSAGEGLYDFTRFEKERKRVMSQLSGNASLNETEGTGANADLWHTVMNLMAGDKLSPHAANLAFRTIIETQKGIATSQGTLIDMLSGMTPDGDMSYRVGTNPTAPEFKEEEHFRETLRILLEDKTQRNVGGASMGDGSSQGWFFEYVNKMMESSSTNLRNEALQEFFEAATGKKDAIWGDPNSLFDNIIDKSKFSESELQNIQGSLNQGISDLREASLQKLQGQRQVVTNKRSQRVNEELATKYHTKVMQSAFSEASGVNTSLDFIAPILLTVLGAGIMSGNINEEAVGQAVGGSIMALGYMRSGRMLESLSQVTPETSQLGKTTRSLTRGLLGGLVSSSFKLNATLQETNGDIGEAMVLSMGREIGFVMGSNLVAPTIEKTVMNLSTKHLERNNKRFMEYEVRNLSRGQQLDYMLKGVNAALDPDDFAATKGTLSTISGALLSGFMGLIMGNVGVKMAASAYTDFSDRQMTEFALVEQALNTLQDVQMESSRRNAEREASPDIYDEYGYSVDVYEATPFEDYYMRAISDSTVSIEQLINSEDQSNSMVFPDLT